MRVAFRSEPQRWASGQITRPRTDARRALGRADTAVRMRGKGLDEGRYLCSMSTMYRIARAAGQSRERRRQATHPAKVKPELCADGPSRVWSWDIAKLRGPTKGVYYHLYVLIDIFYRYNPGWIVSTVEECHLAVDCLADAIANNGAARRTRSTRIVARR
jgi:putative transposase